MKLHISDLQTDLPLKHQKKKLQSIVDTLLEAYDKQYDELSITFVDSKEIKRLHKEFFDDPSMTDCISLPMDDADDEGYKILGELFICPKAAIDYTKKNGGDAYKETTLYVIHGFLHLLGYDDIKLQDRKKMRAEELVCMNILEKKKLLLQDRKKIKLTATKEKIST